MADLREGGHCGLELGDLVRGSGLAPAQMSASCGAGPGLLAGAAAPGGSPVSARLWAPPAAMATTLLKPLGAWFPS
mgnify:CR=1 FL=1